MCNALIRSLVACGTLCWSLVPANATVGQSALAEPQHVDVYVAGEGGYHTYRIPSVIATLKGTLLAFAEGRRGGSGDAGAIDLVLRRSRDGGRSWSRLEVIGDGEGNTFGNPCPVVDRTSGVIWLLTTRNLGTDSEKDILAGTSRASRTVWLMKSGDDGDTWSRATEITSSVKRPHWTWYATGPGIGIQTRTGRLVIPANHAEAGTLIHRSHVILSDDAGRSWRVGAISDAGTNESQVVELADGRLMLNMRNHPARPEIPSPLGGEGRVRGVNFRMVATSADGGRSLSTAREDRTLVEPPAQASLLRFTTTRTHDRNRLLFANPASAKRERLTVRVSYDEGESWPVARTIHEGPAAYSSLVVLSDQSIGLLFERGEKSLYERITFSRFTLEWLTDGKDRLPSRHP